MGKFFPTADDVIRANRRAIEMKRITKAERHELIKPKESIVATMDRIQRSKKDTSTKAAMMLRDINKKHFFGSANKRTSYLVADSYLFKKTGTTKLHKNKEVKFIKDIRKGKKTLGQIKRWLHD